MSSQPPLLDLVIDALEEMKAKNITSLDVRAVTSVADDMVIASGSNSAKKPRGRAPKGKNGLPKKWDALNGEYVEDMEVQPAQPPAEAQGRCLRRCAGGPPASRRRRIG